MDFLLLICIIFIVLAILPKKPPPPKQKSEPDLTIKGSSASKLEKPEPRVLIYKYDQKTVDITIVANFHNMGKFSPANIRKTTKTTFDLHLKSYKPEKVNQDAKIIPQEITVIIKKSIIPQNSTIYVINDDDGTTIGHVVV